MYLHKLGSDFYKYILMFLWALDMGGLWWRDLFCSKTYKVLGQVKEYCCRMEREKRETVVFLGLFLLKKTKAEFTSNVLVRLNFVDVIKNVRQKKSMLSIVSLSYHFGL